MALILFNQQKVLAQTTPTSPVGEYYLRGVAETACGFKLNEDSTFQFFFSYGALDRQGGGRWTVQGNEIVFNSPAQPAQDFALVTSGIGAKNKITIQLVQASEMMLGHLHCRVVGGGREQEVMSNKKGIVQFQPQPIDSIELTFEFCPEKKSTFYPSNKKHHLFTFRPEPWIRSVSFHDFRLTRTADGLTGGHPLSADKSFRYEKAP